VRQLIALILLVPLFALADAEAAALAAVRDLGAVNGQALACGHRATAARAKALMLDRAPRTYAYGEAFQDGTNTAFNAQTRMAPEACPTAPALDQHLDELSARMAKLLPAPAEGAR